MGFRRVEGDVKLACDLPVGESCREITDEFELARGHPLDEIVGRDSGGRARIETGGRSDVVNEKAEVGGGTVAVEVVDDCGFVNEGLDELVLVGEEPTLRALSGEHPLTLIGRVTEQHAGEVWALDASGGRYSPPSAGWDQLAR